MEKYTVDDMLVGYGTDNDIYNPEDRQSYSGIHDGFVRCLL